MRKLNGFILLCAFVVAGSTANADIIIDNQSIPSADIDTINLSPATGHLYVATFPGYSVVKVGSTSTNVAINSFTIVPNAIFAGDSFTVNWDVSNGVSCVGGGGVGGWSNVSYTLPTGSVSLTTTRLGVKTFTLTCYGAQAGDSASASATLTISDPAAPPTVAITGFSSSKTTMTEGDTTTISWATENATSCTPSGGAGGWNTKSIGLPSGSANIAISTADTYTFNLTCVDASANSAVKSAVVTVNPPPTACAASPLGTGDIKTWNSYWGVNFPNPYYDQKYAYVPRTSYLALEFNTGNIVSSGRFTSVETSITGGARIGSISQCPGDFDVSEDCKYAWGIGGGLNWVTDGGAGCQLQPNTTYYFNLTHTDGFDPNTTTCSSVPCVTYLQHEIR